MSENEFEELEILHDDSGVPETITVLGDGYPVAYFETGHETDKAERYARLLVASPMLLEACRVSVRYLDERDGDRGGRPNPVRELLAEAISAATGRHGR